MYLSRYLKSYPCPDKPGRVLLVATQRCTILECSVALWEKICSGGEISQEEQTALLRLGVLVADRAAELEEMRLAFGAPGSSHRHISVTVALSRECDLGCCHEDPVVESFFMVPETADLLVQRLTERISAGFDVTIDFCGEPLLRLELLARIVGPLSEAADIKGVKFAFNLFTDGVLLTPCAVQHLLPLGLSSVHLIFDFPPDVHNTQRPFSGSARLAVILKNLREVYQLVPVDLGGNYTRDNYRDFTLLLNMVIEEGIEPSGINEVAFSPVKPKVDGCAAEDLDSACSCAVEPWMIEAEIFLRGEIIRRGFPVAMIKPGARMIHPANDLVVGYDGSIYRCPTLVGCQEMRVGSLGDEVSPFPLPDETKNSVCLECVYLPLCFSNCGRTILHASLEQFLGQEKVTS